MSDERPVTSGGDRAPRAGDDLSLVRELVSSLTSRLVGRSVAIGADGSRLRGTITAVAIDPADYTMTSRLEAGFDAWSGVNDAALGALAGRDPLRVGLNMFGAAVTGFERMLGSSPVNPIEGIIRLATSARIELGDARHDRWQARALEIELRDVQLVYDAGLTAARAGVARAQIRLRGLDLSESLRALGLGGEDVVIEDSMACVVRRIGPVRLSFPVEVRLEDDDVVVEAQEIAVRGWRVAVPSRFARSWRVSRRGLIGRFTIDGVDIADGELVVSASAENLTEPVTTTQLRELVAALQNGRTDVRVERVSGSRARA